MTKPSATDGAWAVALGGLEWLAANYASVRFFTERDVVWTLLRWYSQQVADQRMPISVFNDFGAEPGQYRALSADIALVLSDSPPIVMEFKYEPSHRRVDIGRGKFPVIAWSGVASDAERVERWVRDARAAAGIAVLIDEGGAFAARAAAGHRWPVPVVAGGTWSHWGTYDQPDLDVYVHCVAVAPQAD